MILEGYAVVGYPSSILVSQVTNYREAHCSQDSPMGVTSCLTGKYLSYCIVNSLLFSWSITNPILKFGWNFWLKKGWLGKILNFRNQIFGRLRWWNHYRSELVLRIWKHVRNENFIFVNVLIPYVFHLWNDMWSFRIGSTWGEYWETNLTVKKVSHVTSKKYIFQQKLLKIYSKFLLSLKKDWSIFR